MKITDAIHLLKIDFEIQMPNGKRFPRFVNVIVIFGPKITIIDTGVKGSEKQIFDYIEANNRSIMEIDSIILSHSHPDHIGAAAQIKKLCNCRVLAHNSAKLWIEDINAQNAVRPVPGFFKLVNAPVTVDDVLHDGHVLESNENLHIKVIHTPGHSKGSVSLYFIEEKILFTADGVPLNNDLPNYDNYYELLSSLHKLRSIETEILLSSWAVAKTNQDEISQYYAEGKSYMKKIHALVKKIYKTKESSEFDHCQKVLSELGLPVFLASKLINHSFQSHLV